MGEGRAWALALSVAGTLGVLGGAACSKSPFLCESDSDCSGGFCQQTNYCAFTDGECASGLRYGDLAPGQIAGTCVDPQDSVGGDPNPEPSVTSGVASTDTSLGSGSTMGVADEGPDPLGEDGFATTDADGSESLGETDGDTTGDDETSGGGTTTGPKLGCAQYSDDFEDGTIASYWDEFLPDLIREGGGRIEFTTDPPNETFPSIALDDTCDLSNGFFRAHLGPFPGGTTSLRVSIATPSNSSVVMFVLEGSEIIARSAGGGPGDYLFDDYDPGRPWVQIRGDGDMVFFETSADGENFTEFASAKSFFPLTLVRPSISSGAEPPVDGKAVVSVLEVVIED